MFTDLLWRKGVLLSVAICPFANTREITTNRAARLSMLMALVRIIPIQFRLYQLAIYSAWLYVAFVIALLAQKIPICVRTAPEWTTLAKPQCHLGMDVGILELCSQSFAYFHCV